MDVGVGVGMWVCGYVGMWVCGYVGGWVGGWVCEIKKFFFLAIKEITWLCDSI